jgi:hypothetical protein
MFERLIDRWQLSVAANIRAHTPDICFPFVCLDACMLMHHLTFCSSSSIELKPVWLSSIIDTNYFFWTFKSSA